jgi:deoxyribodipyrimidine photolyase
MVLLLPLACACISTGHPWIDASSTSVHPHFVFVQSCQQSNHRFALLCSSPDVAAGYPWIDAAMRQLSEWGWMHHLARHSVACFLTRGDLYISWEEGKAVFEELLLDAVRTV